MQTLTPGNMQGLCRRRATNPGSICAAKSDIKRFCEFRHSGGPASTGKAICRDESQHDAIVIPPVIRRNILTAAAVSSVFPFAPADAPIVSCASVGACLKWAHNCNNALGPIRFWSICSSTEDAHLTDEAQQYCGRPYLCAYPPGFKKTSKPSIPGSQLMDPSSSP